MKAWQELTEERKKWNKFKNYIKYELNNRNKWKRTLNKNEINLKIAASINSYLIFKVLAQFFY